MIGILIKNIRKMFKRIIFIGETQGKTIYFDRKTNTIYQAEKSKFINTKEAKRELIFMPAIVFFVVIFRDEFKYLPGMNINLGTMGWISLIFQIIIWLVLSLSLGIFMHRAYYRNVKKRQIATKKQFGMAIRGSLIYQNYMKNGKTTRKGRRQIWIATIALIILSFMPILIGYLYINQSGKSLTLGLLLSFSSLGLMPPAAYSVLYANNPFIWTKIAEQYFSHDLKINTDTVKTK